MKLLRFGEPGAERPGILDAAGIARDLSGVIDDISGETLLDEGMELDDYPIGADRVCGDPIGRFE
jgi:hypothetical protein